MIGATSRTLATLLVAIVITVVTGLLLLTTTGGSAWLVDAATGLTDGQVTATGVRGTLLGGLQVERLEIRAGRTSIVIEPAELTMSWPDLLRQRVRLTTARARDVTVTMAPRPPDAPDTPVEPLLLPFAIVAENLELGRLTILAGGEPIRIDKLRLSGELVGGEINFSSLAAEFYGIEASAHGSFGTGEPFALRADLRWAMREPGVQGRGSVSGSLEKLRFEQVVQVPDPVGVGGVLRLLDDVPEIIAEARWQSVTRDLAGTGPLVSDAGRLRVRGWTDAYSAELEAGVRVAAWPRVLARLGGAGTLEAFTFDRIRLEALDGNLTGRGRLGFADGLRGAFQLQGRGINPQALDPRFAGKLDFTGQLAFDPEGTIAVTVPKASGTLFKRPFRASGAVTKSASGFAFDKVSVAAGPNRVEFAGSWGDRIAGRFRIDAPDLATLWPDLRGRLRGDGELGGTAAKPAFSVNLDGAGLGVASVRIDALRARGGLGPRESLDLELTATGISLGDQAVGDLEATVAGRLAAHTLKLALTGGEVAARLEADGGWKQGVLREEFREGFVVLPGEQRWDLRDPAPLRLAGTDLLVGAHCWTFEAAELCLADARSDARGLSGGARLRQFPLSGVAPFIAKDLDIGGTADVDLEARREGTRLTGRLHGELRDAVFNYRAPDGDDVTTSLSEFRIDVDATDEAVDYSAVVAESFGLHLEASGRVSDPFGGEPTITGKLTGGVPDLKTLEPVIERFVDIGDLKGRVTLDVGLTGRARQPDISGGLELADGSLTVVAAGVSVDRITLAVLGGEDGTARIKGGARSGKGYVAIEGSVLWRDRLLPAAEVTVKGRVFDVIRLPEGYVQVSPDVRVVLQDRQFRVTGEVLVPRAEITVKKLEAGAVRPSPDTVVHGRDLALVAKEPPLFVLDGLNVRLGKKVTFDGFGLKTGLTGGLSLSQSLGADPTVVTGDGVVKLEEGKFAAFGQKLDIERGSLIFAGTVTDPGLDVKASREVTYQGRDVTVGVLLSGNLSRIETRVFSEPAMGEMDALSYLTTGKPLSAAGAGDRSAVTNSALSLGLTTAMPVVQQLGSALHLDEVGLDSSAAGGTAVVVGEQLGKNLFIRYSYGVFDQLVTFTATYKLGRRVSIEASSGGEQALDLIYSINW